MVKTRDEQEVSLAHLVTLVDVQPSRPVSNPHEREFRFLLVKKKLIVETSSTAFLKKKTMMTIIFTTVVRLDC